MSDERLDPGHRRRAMALGTEYRGTADATKRFALLHYGAVVLLVIVAALLHAAEKGWLRR